MLIYLWNHGGALDFADTKTLLAERDSEWDASKVPQIYFNRVEKAIQGLTQAGITSDLNERRDMALYFLKASGEFDAAVRGMGTAASGPENVAKQQNLHFSRVRKEEQAKQTYRKELQSQHDQRAS